jgi:nuclear pore complex protein Nup62
MPVLTEYYKKSLNINWSAYMLTIGMYVYMYICMYICIYMYVCIYVYECIYIYVCIYVFIYIHTYICIYIYLCTYVCMYYICTYESTLNNHSYIYQQRCIMFLSQYFSFPLSVSFHQCSILIHSSSTLYHLSNWQRLQILTYNFMFPFPSLSFGSWVM